MPNAEIEFYKSIGENNTSSSFTQAIKNQLQNRFNLNRRTEILCSLYWGADFGRLDYQTFGENIFEQSSYVFRCQRKGNHDYDLFGF